jgi:hypothetical protein
VSRPEEADHAEEPGSAPLTDEQRRRRRAAVFGEVLPESTRDDSADGWSEPERRDSDEWLRRQVPPHHG